MKTIDVKKSELLKRISENRKNHRKEFLEALEGYRRASIAELERMIDDARNGRKFQRFVSMPEPEDHTADYDRAIEMLEMCVDEIVEISESDFAMLVMDDWGWKGAFVATNSFYKTSR